MMRLKHISVLIPARNEEALLRRCLLSIMEAREELPLGVSCDIVVAADCCTDRTYQIASRMLGRTDYGVAIETKAGIVGSARAIAAETAFARRSVRHDHWWLANTDADCIVPIDWLTSQVTIAENGVTAIAGIVDVDSFIGHESCVEQRFRSTYLVRPDGSHPHVHGANLGIRADAYSRAGGWRDLETAEDHDLWKRLGTMHCERVSTSAVRVLTSGRRAGRAPRGFADALAAHNEFAA